MAAVQTLDDPRVRRAAQAVLAALGVALLVATLSGSGASTASGRLGGDHVEFYGTAKMVLDGQLDQLYEPEAQRAAQAPYAGDDGGFLYFGYPPHVAVLYAPLAVLPFRVSYLVSTLAMVGASFAALWLVRPMVPILRSAWWPCLALSLTFAPLFVGVGLGQNTGLSLLLIAATWRLLHDDREVAAGVALGLLLYKPQLAIPLVVFVAASGRWRTLAGTVVTGIATWLVGAAILGVGWVGTWLDGLDAFGDIDRASNAANNLSLLGIAEARAHGSAGATVVAGALAVAVLTAVSWLWWRRSTDDLAGAMAVAVPAALLLAPHALYYDGGLIILTGLVVLSRLPRSLLAVLATWALGFGQVFAKTFGVTPVAATVVIAFVGGWTVVGRGPRGSHGAEPDLVSSRS